MEPELPRCPATDDLLTLVENAIRHGIDPALMAAPSPWAPAAPGQGVNLWVSDTGVGMSESAGAVGA